MIPIPSCQSSQTTRAGTRAVGTRQASSPRRPFARVGLAALVSSACCCRRRNRPSRGNCSFDAIPRGVPSRSSLRHEASGETHLSRTSMF